MTYVFAVPAQSADSRPRAHALLRWAYGRVAGAPMPPLRRTALGKPYFAGGALDCSLSHTKTLAVCALRDGPVGVDAETLRPLRPGLAERTMNPPALAWLAAQPDADRAFLTLWTRKEAWSKLCGTGLRGRPRDIVLSWEEGEPGVAGQTARFETREWARALVTVCTPQREPVEWTFLPDLPPESEAGTDF